MKLNIDIEPRDLKLKRSARRKRNFLAKKLEDPMYRNRIKGVDTEYKRKPRNFNKELMELYDNE